MLKKIFLLILLTPLLSFGQKSNIKNQKKIYDLEKKLVHTKDEGAIQLQLSELYWKIYPEKSIHYGKQAIQNFKKTTF